MPAPVKFGVPVLGIIFLGLTAIKLIEGEAWVVWAILAFLFGGFTIFNRKRSEGDPR